MTALARMRLTPCTRDQCVSFVRAHHRHCAPSKRYRMAIAAAVGERRVGVAELGTPAALARERAQHDLELGAEA